MTASMLISALAVLAISGTLTADPKRHDTSASPLVGAHQNGPVTLTFMPTGHAVAVYSETGIAMTISHWSDEDGTLTVSDRHGFGACPREIEGKYAYEVTDAGTVFTLISDDCADRAASATAAPWVRIDLPE